MSNEFYKLSFTAEDIDQKLRKMDGAVVFSEEQNLSKAQKEVALLNIGAESVDTVAALKDTLGLSEGKNLFNILTITEGYFIHQNTGVLTASSNFNASDYIKVSPETDYTISVKTLSTGTSAQIRYFQYDGNQTD